MHEAPHQIFHQILHGEHIRDQKMQMVPARSRLPQAAEQEFAQYIVGSDQGQRIIKELRVHDEIGAYVFPAGPLHAMHGVLIEKQQLARSQRQGRIAFDMVDRLSAAHVYDLHVVVAVHGKTGKARVGAQGDELSIGQQFVAVDDKAVAGAVKRPVHRTARQQFLFFLRHLAEFP